MKREIKVKGQPIGKMGLWVYGIGAYKTNTAEHLIINAKGESVEVVHLCWWTGLKDKRGAEVYEDDIIADDHGNKHVIKYDEKQARFIAVNISSGLPWDSCSITKQWIEECGKEVIGNIHDNPELIKQ